ncbi:RNB domain-containing ribonuclease [Conexibacter woesei]|uniref:RNB domain-containing ribonuclease n=1 Tax=Conexibacter woesei TaxID=191495 RepID=UPI000400CCA6|nr:RNB domain-containing ribonuclease [Conexibacter woesei]
MSPRDHGRQGRRGRPEQAESFVVGVLAKQGRFVVLEPFFDLRGVGRRSSFVVDPGRNGRTGQLVLVRAGGKVRGHPKVVKVIGKPDVARDVIEALMLDRGLRRSFPPGVERAAAEAVEKVDPDRGRRRDLRSLATFTIDPATARDFDDAISAEAIGEAGDGAWRVWVHIADVSAYVRSGSAVDREAYRRATSVYVPGAVEPMLPEVLSNGACSLVPDQERLAVTVELEVRGEDVVRTSFYRSLVRSDQRLDYDRVDRIFAGAEDAAAPWAAPLAAARAASAALRARRERAGALAVESTEPEFAFDRGGHVKAAEASVQTESHQLIEHLMIAANEAVARLLSEREIPALYRIHERPEPPAAERLMEQLASLGVPTPPVPEQIEPGEAAEIIAAASQLVAEEVRRRGGTGGRGLTSLVLRSLKQARYSPENKGHAGLHSTAYAHFTSPIRRYPDLVCHRALLSAVGGGEEEPRASTLPEAADWTSSRERDAMQIERAADDVANAFLLERLIFEAKLPREQEAEVVGLVGAGAFMSFGASFEGFLPARRLGGRDDWWELNEPGTILTGEPSGATVRIGQTLPVLIRRIDPPRGRVELDLDRSSGPPRRA